MHASNGTPDLAWWQSGIVYQIYPRSFQDSDGNGVGDLRGVMRRLDYLEDLGVDAIWISPIYPSPMADFGYDIADYRDIDPLFGTLEQFDALVAEVHRRGMRLIMDFVPNHTSDRHPWFLESRSSRDALRRDWYLWCDPAPDGSPPNNWLSNFGGSAWQLDEATGQYYYHAFLKEQPDLNWRNHAVRKTMYDVLRFWLDRGVDGFRVDVLWHLIKDARFRDNPPNPDYEAGDAQIRSLLQLHSVDQPEVHEVVREMRAVLDEYGDRVLIGEIYLPLKRLVAYYGDELGGAQMPFNFQLVQAPWNAGVIADIIRDYEAALPAGGWPNWVLGNHDKPRIAARVGHPQSRLASMLLLTLRGTPTVYYGDEIGLGGVEIAPQDARDPWEKRETGIGVGRDPERTPMQWDDSPAAGFTTGRPWLPVTPDYAVRNVRAQLADPRSILNLVRRLIALRRTRRELVEGACESVRAQGTICTYRRRLGDRALFMALNMGSAPARMAMPREFAGGYVVQSTRMDRSGGLAGDVALQADEGVIVAPAGG